MVLRVLVVCWVLGLAGVAGLRWRRDRRVVKERLRSDVMAGFLVGTFVWGVLVIAF